MLTKINSETLYRELLRRIIDLELYPGMRISENAVSEEFDVSRSVVRNAFARLAQSKLLKVYPQRGTYVNLVDLNYIRKALLIRVSVEKEMLRRFMRQADKEETLKKMERNLEEQRKYYDEKRYIDKFRLLDEEFHNLIIASQGSEDILYLMDTHLLHIARWRNIYVRSGVYLAILVDQHTRILEAIWEDDLDKALEATEIHIDTVHDMVVIDPDFADYFQ
ncbi:Uncharacterized HTH-type transcriptional regulator ydfH [Aedoeadaptatus ivorii]|uniref:Uncharacterized HTH-type transcriptional regulator ydfH n=1 Tax=Aedoeadaptatus ivorii TaxID=54006 RepID=A0A3S5C206_9FIRM|nr:GntR family transcriptional regulator [Peptoniphilus ivorii]MDQ0508493.1 DNA-binding GntR family transcriptional regulator [Peptoniphilus ivorii]VEJ34281.1 Uncharacterized HTH-type transcriptional regulator ydfH [Peptoniphilus ivorii]